VASVKRYTNQKNLLIKPLSVTSFSFRVGLRSIAYRFDHRLLSS